MNTEQFNKILDKFQTEMTSMGETKGADYTIGSDDRLNNFKQVGELVCCPNCQKPIGSRAVFGVYLLKHIMAILAWIKAGRVESEGLFGRFLDTSLYSVLGFAISEEQKDELTDGEVIMYSQRANVKGR